MHDNSWSRGILALGCKRVIFDTNYLKALHRPNMELNYNGIAAISETGILTQKGVCYASLINSGPDMEWLMLRRIHPLRRFDFCDWFRCGKSFHLSFDRETVFIELGRLPPASLRKKQKHSTILWGGGRSKSLLRHNIPGLSQLLFNIGLVQFAQGALFPDSLRVGPNAATGYSSVLFSNEVQVCAPLLRSQADIKATRRSVIFFNSSNRYSKTTYLPSK